MAPTLATSTEEVLVAIGVVDLVGAAGLNGSQRFSWQQAKTQEVRFFTVLFASLHTVKRIKEIW